MGSKSSIEWLEGGSTWNPVMGCSPVSDGCMNCYALNMISRYRGLKGWLDLSCKVQTFPERLQQPLKWKKPRKIFVCSMSDLFHEDVPNQFICRIFDVIEKCPQHTFIILTKRPENMYWQLVENSPCEYPIHFDDITGVPLPNVWLGVTAENQEQADKRIPTLLQIPAAVRFVLWT